MTKPYKTPFVRTRNIRYSGVWLTSLEQDVKYNRKCNRKRFVIPVVSILLFKLINVKYQELLWGGDLMIPPYSSSYGYRRAVLDCSGGAQNYKQIVSSPLQLLYQNWSYYYATLCLLLKETNKIMSEQAHFNIYFDLSFSLDKRFKTNYSGCHLFFWFIKKLHSDNWTQ